MSPPAPRPPWLKVRAPAGETAEAVGRALSELGLRTVCREARCPNAGECWGAGTATVLVLGGACTRRCAFCGVGGGAPDPPDPGEAARVARAAAILRWRHVVVTSVTRDDLPDGGASHFARVAAALRGLAPPPAVELLVPDFGGSAAALAQVVDARPDVLAHNVETVPRLYPEVRPGADYRRSLALLAAARAADPSMTIKSGLMVGLGETREEVDAVLSDLRAAGCGSVTVGQYLPPSRAHRPAASFVPPEAFAEIAAEARRIGFRVVAAGPLVRSSLRAGG